jgi:DNA repair protein RAD50
VSKKTIIASVVALVAVSFCVYHSTHFLSILMSLYLILNRTTIIESLKFAVCGALPPGNKSGQAFVHDPRSIGQSTVKANVKVRFTNRAGTSMVVVRSMEVQQKKTTLTFKQLDGVLRTVDKHGNRQSLSHKCSELDRQIPLLLGVSKSILEHVVFCHQEDASWPLQEGAVLKKRFDDIFDSSRYSKALEVFAKEKKTYSAIVKDLKAELAGLSSHKHASKGFQQEVSNYNAQIEELEEEMTDSRSAITEMDADRDRLKGIMEQVEDLNHDLESKRNELFQQQAVVKKQRTMLQEDLTKQHTVRELQQMLRDFDTQIDKQVERQQELQDELSARQGELSRLRNEETELQSQLGRLQGEHESHEKRLQLRYEKMMEIGSSHDLGDVLTPISQTQPSETQNTNTSYMDSSMAANNTIALSQPILDIPEEDMREFYDALEKKEAELKEALVSNRNKRQQEEDKLQTILADLKGKLNSIENDRERLGKESSEARRELQSINSQVSTTSRHRKSDVEEAKRVAAKFSKERDEANADPRRTEIPTEIRSMEEKIDKYKREIEDDQIALRDLRHSAEAQNAIAVLREQCAKDLETLQERMQEETYAMQKNKISFPPELPGARGGDANGEELVTAFESMVVSVTSKHESANLELIKATADMNGIQRLVSEKSALLSYNQNMLAPKKARMNLLSGENGSIDKVRRVVKAVREYQQSIGITTPNLDESQPQELLSYLESRLQEEEAESTEGIQPQVIKKVITRLKKQVSLSVFWACNSCQLSLAN